uniref:HintN domain-containing protein n=1 Tax=Elaeophora elaphi TaxID=1147741 RepID=A0A0R3RWT1_9BILA
MMLLRSMVLLLSLSLLMKHSAAITYRCDDDQIIVVQSFGNDTIRMHCQKPIVCGLRYLKCHYNHSQSYCGGKTNFVAHLQQSTPVAPVVHTCCNLAINEDVHIKAHTGNDCFLYDLPDGSNATTGEELEKADKEGYTLLKNVNKVPEQFADFSGYRLRLYLLRKKEPSQFVVKGVERNEAGYRVTICSIQCKNDSEKVMKVIHGENQVVVSKKEPAVSDINLNQVKLTLRNLTDDGQWIIATWAEWSYKHWSEWSTERKIEFDSSNGTKGSGHRYRLHHTDNGTGKGQQKSEGIKTSIHKLQAGHHRVHKKKKDSSDCGDDEYSAEEVDKKERKSMKHSDKVGDSKEELSGSDNQEKLKSKLDSHETDGTEGKKKDLFISRPEQIGKKTKDSFAVTKEGDKSHPLTKTSRATTPPSISTTKKDQDRNRIKSKDTKIPTLAREKIDGAKKGAMEKKKLPKDQSRGSANQTAILKKAKQPKKTHELEQKTSDKDRENQHGEKQHQRLLGKQKFLSTKSPQYKASTKSVSSARKSQIGHDPDPAPVAQRAQVRAHATPPMNCFSADTKVHTLNGEKTMKEVSVGDFVLVPVSKNQLRYERVEMFYHREPETRAKFVVLETESGRKLSLTELHLLPLGDCKQMHESMSDTTDIVDQWLRKSKFAHKARMGDCVFTVTANHQLQVDRIVKIGRQYLKGIYSPMTVEGSILADGVLASCFSQVESHFSQKLVYDFLVFLYRIFGQLIQSIDEPIQHLPTFIDSIYHLGRFAVPFVKY